MMTSFPCVCLLWPFMWPYTQSGNYASLLCYVGLCCYRKVLQCLSKSIVCTLRSYWALFVDAWAWTKKGAATLQSSWRDYYILCSSYRVSQCKIGAFFQRISFANVSSILKDPVFNSLLCGLFHKQVSPLNPGEKFFLNSLREQYGIFL